MNISPINYNYTYKPQFQSKTSLIKTEEVIQFINNGTPVKAISSHFGISLGTYYKMLRERGIEYNQQALNPELRSITKEQIENMLEKKIPIPQICKTLKITENAYYNLVERLGIKHPNKILSEKLAKISKEKIIELINANLSVRKICTELDISESSYYDLLNKFKIETPRKQIIQNNSSIKKEQIIELQNSGKTFNEIINILNISDTAYCSLLNKFSLATPAKIAKANIKNITKEKLEEYIASGKTIKQICSELNISERTYTRLVDSYGISTNRKKSKEHIATITQEKLQKLVNQKLPVSEICNELQITNGMFYVLLKRLHVKYDYQQHSNEIPIAKRVLEQEARSKKTTSQISTDLGISVTTYHAKARAAKVKTVLRNSIDHLASIKKEDLQSSIDSGLTVKEICKKYNLTLSNYLTLQRKYNLSTPQRKAINQISQISKAKIIELKNQKKSVKEICEELNISQSSYYRILNTDIK